MNEATTGSSCHFNAFALQTLQGGSRRREKMTAPVKVVVKSSGHWQFATVRHFFVP